MTPGRLNGVLLAALALAAAASLAVGPVGIPWSAWLDPHDPRGAVLVQLRLPRTLLGALTGGVLGLSGAALQGYTRNPLADPGVLGVSATASLGAVLALYFGAAALGAWVTPVVAVAFAALGALALVGLAGRASGVADFLLAGVVVQTVAGAGVALALNLAPNPWAAEEIVDWLMGSLADRSFTDLALAAPFALAGAALLLSTGRALDALTLGEEAARSLGAPLGRTRALLTAGVALAVGAVTAVTGVIGFVGLVTPHLLRPLVGSRPGALLVPSALGGAALLLAADVAVRLIPSAAPVKLGVATAVVGGPFFLWLLLRRRGRLA